MDGIHVLKLGGRVHDALAGHFRSSDVPSAAAF